jgi:hypothetical protein
MPTWLKGILITLGVIIVLVSAVGTGIYVWWQRNGEAMIASGRVAMDEGSRFAAGKDSWACADEAARRSKGAGFNEAINAGVFLGHCLPVAKLAPGFCDGVPGPTDILAGVSWQAQLNQKYGLSPPFETTALPQQIQKFCAVQAKASSR